MASDVETVDGTVDEVTEADVVSTPTGTAVARRERRSEVIRPLDPDALVESFAAYQELLPRLLDASDWQGEPNADDSFVKKSGWRKIATAFDLDVFLVSEEVERDHDGRILRSKCVARAVAPGGRAMEADGFCTRDEFTGRRASNPKLENDLRGTASTRAKNRAISDLVGMGKVSAEEVDAAGARTQGPPFGAPVDKAKRESVMLAIEALIARDDEVTSGESAEALGEAAKEVARAIVASTKTNDDAEPYMPAIVANALFAAANARTARQPTGDDLDEMPEDTPGPDGPAPGTVEPPVLDGISDPAKQVAALRAAGCICPNPTTPEGKDDNCPIKGHGIPF